MPLITPKIDWDFTDPLDGDDLNRIEENTLYLRNISGISDPDGNIYRVVYINGQLWTTSDWRSTKYANGDAIPEITDNTLWAADNSGAYCKYNNDISRYGLLYNQYALHNVGLGNFGLPPDGWRVATGSDWLGLADWLFNEQIGYIDAISIAHYAKSISMVQGWVNSVTPQTPGYEPWNNDLMRFSYAPNGYRLANGTFDGLGEIGYYWASEDVATGDKPFAKLQANTTGFEVDGAGDLPTASQNLGFAVRMVMDL